MAKKKTKREEDLKDIAIIVLKELANCSGVCSRIVEVMKQDADIIETERLGKYFEDAQKGVIRGSGERIMACIEEKETPNT